MRLEPLYRIRFTYPESWMIGLDDGWEQHLFLAEGRCEGSISGRFRGANFPRRRGVAGPFRPDFRAVIETDDGASARSFISVTPSSTSASMTSSASAKARYARRSIPINPSPISCSTLPS